MRLRICIFFVVLNCALYWICTEMLIGLRYSYWFDEKRYNELKTIENDEMIRGAISYSKTLERNIEQSGKISKLKSELFSKMHSPISQDQQNENELSTTTYNLCPIISTIARKKPYLFLLLSKLDYFSVAEQPKETTEMHMNVVGNTRISPLIIYNAEEEPESHIDAHQAGFNFVVFTQNDCQYFNETKRLLDLRKAANHRRKKEWHCKENMDYAISISICKLLKCDWCLVIEDDTIASPFLFEKLEKRFFSTLNFDDELDSDQSEIPIIVKLFQSDYWRGWSTENTHSFIFLCICLSVAMTFITKCFLVKKKSETSLVLVFWIFTISLFVRSMGAQNVFPGFPNGLSELMTWQAFGGTQAYMFNKFAQTSIVNALVFDDCTQPTDVVVDTWTQTEKKKHKSLQLVPHLFQHVGSYSSNKEKNQGDHVHLKTSSQFDSSNAI